MISIYYENEIIIFNVPRIDQKISIEVDKN